MKQLFLAASVLLLIALPFVTNPQPTAAPSADGARPAAICRSAAMDMDASPVTAAAQQLLKVLTPSSVSSQGRHGFHPTMHAIAGSAANLSNIPFRRALQTTQVRLHNELFGPIFNCRAPPAFSRQL